MRLSRNEPLEFRVTCKGLRQEELMAISREFEKELRERPAFRNPSPPLFDANTIHELAVRVPWAIIGAAAGKRAVEKAVDIIAASIERKLSKSEDEYKKVVTIWGPDGKPAMDVIVKPGKKMR